MFGLERLDELERKFSVIRKYLLQKIKGEQTLAATQQDLINAIGKLTEAFQANTQQQAALLAALQAQQPLDPIVTQINGLTEQVEQSTKTLTDANTAALAPVPATPASTT